MKPFKRTWFPLEDHRPAPRTATRAVPTPIDPLTGPRLALAGRVVTMDSAFAVRPDAVVYIDRGAIVAVQDRAAPRPAGFEAVAIVNSGGTIYPGLIELHNHLAYNALPLWSPVPKRFDHRGQWPDHPDYRKLISGPMSVVGDYRDALGQPALLAPLVRYVECKCLMGGVTTSQGIMLNSNAGIQRYYRGILRNVESTDDPDLAEAQGRIADVVAKDAQSFWGRLKKEDSCFLLHLSEGVCRDGQSDSIARRHFLSLQVAPEEWALNDRFAGIHAAGLLPEDFEVLGRHKASMIWSPLSNLLLYGSTARVGAARAAGVRIGLGSDWSPSGSKNLLGELKVAWLYSNHLLDGQFSGRDLMAMATRDAASILKWDKALGSLEAGKRADLVVVTGKTGDPYEAFIKAKETDIRLVMINGVARYGMPAAMKSLGSSGEKIAVGGRDRSIFLEQATADPDVAKVTLGAARVALRQAFLNLPALALELEQPKPAKARRAMLDEPEPLTWSLALDEIKYSGMGMRPRLPLNGPADFTGPKLVASRAVSVPLSSLLRPVELDPLTVADDPNYLSQIAAQPNVPEAVRNGLAALY
ncbi:Amidohydrolase [Rubrivivax sp. A210]|uniref:amidohydrolase family protein n=1 Tax=Rubrivivax sp. A210 TaxID=2772301 RepID=UPI001917FAA0|nr:amidohydrolase family protein [Rubrivivax sp. A210]CAD5371047.1 Amidohydrolase [Rubrivivax sp. A210]